jgi:hypothetical protein
MLVALLEAIEQHSEGPGAYVFGSPLRPEGIALIEDARICWAAVSGSSRRLINLLEKRCSRATSLQEVFRQCQAEGKPFGETLVAMGAVSAEDLRDSLRRNSAENLARLCGKSSVAPIWVERKGLGYSPQFTFTTTEILSAIGSARYGPIADIAGNRLQSFLVNGGWGAAFLRSGDSGALLPISERGTGALGVKGLMKLGTWADDVLVRGLEGRPCNFAAGSFSDKASVVTLREDGVIYAAFCDDPSILGFVLAEMSRQRARNKD